MNHNYVVLVRYEKNSDTTETQSEYYKDFTVLV